ncbi:hypothetical protein HOY80DRAFT_986674, partial [Tuber brumale]
MRILWLCWPSVGVGGFCGPDGLRTDMQDDFGFSDRNGHYKDSRFGVFVVGVGLVYCLGRLGDGMILWCGTLGQSREAGSDDGSQEVERFI